jgi:xanthine dehydrogenase accessory factor
LENGETIMLDILNGIENWLQNGRRVALATVIETWGSAPRQAGAKMGVSDQTGMVGSVSGGCVETAVVQEALDSLSDQKPRVLKYGVSDDTAWEVGLACGGKISIYVEPLDAAWWKKAREGVKHNHSLTTITIISGAMAGQKLLVDSGEVIYSTVQPEWTDKLVQAAAGCDSTSHIVIDDVEVLIDVYRPAPRLIMIGGAHVAMALKTMAHLLGFRVILVDPRSAFATTERFPDVEVISHQYPDKFLPEIGLNADSYVAILTHDPKIDDPALKVALASAAPYIGVLSSKRTHEKRIERLTKAGIDPELMKRIRTPIGLEIGAQTPEEIALCIMAEIVAVRNGALS